MNDSFDPKSPEENDDSPLLPSARSSARSSVPLGPFKLSMRAKVGLVAIVAGLAIAAQLASRYRQNEAVPKGIVVEPDTPAEAATRERAANFSLQDIQGRPTDFASFKGQVVLVAFWASWCAPCLVEIPTFVEVEKRFAGRGLKVVAVNVDEDAGGRTSAQDFWRSKAFPFPTFFDLDKRLQGQFKVEILPTNFVFDRLGRIAFRGFGANDWGSPETIELLEQLVLETADAQGT